VVIGYISDSSEDVEVVATCSSRCSAVGGIEPSVISISSDSHSMQGLADSASSHPQYTGDDLMLVCPACGSYYEDDLLLVCPTCGSYYEVDTECPLC
jgi:rRNA maturation endonuclease Nob1